MMSARFAYKFLARGAVGPVSRARWPLPERSQAGAWIGAEEPVALCRSGVHACLKEHLAFWLHEELWRVELEGDLSTGLDCVLSPRGRLVQRIEAWSEEGGAQRFAVAVRDHAASLIDERPEDERAALRGYVEDASWHVNNARPESPALAALCSSMAVAKLSVVAKNTNLATDTESEALEHAYRLERAWQSAWIVDQMGLT
jgi:hypothetical protein